jgi:hypothetical protein
MSTNYYALTLGDSEIYLNDQHMGLAIGLTLHKVVERLAVEQSTAGELAARHLVPLRRTLTVEVRLKELSPAALSFFAAGGTNTYFDGANLGVTDYVRLYEKRPSQIRFFPQVTPMVKSVDGSILYTEDVDYSSDWENRQFSLISEGGIEPGQLLKVLYTTDYPAGREIPLAHSGTVTTKLEALHRYPDGLSFMVLLLRRVELDASGILATGTEDLVDVPLIGRCLADDSHPDSPFGYVRFYGEMMSRMENRP